MHRDNVTETHSEGFAHYFVHADLAFFTELVSKDNAHGILTLLALDEHSITTEQLKLVHLLKVEGHDTVIVVNSFVC